MRRIDKVKNKTMKGIDKIKILDSKSVQIFFKNNQNIILQSYSTDFGYDSEIRIIKDNI